MSNITTETLRCAVCGKESDQRIVLSHYTADTFLDQKPAPSVLPFTLECPHCHYAADDLSAPVSEETRAYIRSTEYQEQALRQQDTWLRRLENAATIAEHQQKWAEASYRWLVAAWYCEDHALAAQARADRARSVQMDEAVPNLGLTPAQMLTYIDSLRQLGRFTRAEQVAVPLEPEFVRLLGAEHLLTKILRRITELVRAGDAAPHLVSEVK